MTDPVDSRNVLLQRALDGDESALAALFHGYRERLRRMIRLRLDRRLSGRVDSSDVLQDSYLDVRKTPGRFVSPFPGWAWGGRRGRRRAAISRRVVGDRISSTPVAGELAAQPADLVLRDHAEL
jgi:DNA-directed RNA polymerase specialized sigma24 family protein